HVNRDLTPQTLSLSSHSGLSLLPGMHPFLTTASIHPFTHPIPLTGDFFLSPPHSRFNISSPNTLR
ncbi:hypothetical protein SK128_008236, partial [Halocaridina rubra]